MLKTNEAEWGEKLGEYIQKTGLTQTQFVKLLYEDWCKHGEIAASLQSINIRPHEALKEHTRYISLWKNNKKALPKREEMLFLVWGLKAVLTPQEATEWMQLGGYGPLGSEETVFLFDNSNMPFQPQFVESSVTQQPDKTQFDKEENKQELILISIAKLVRVGKDNKIAIILLCSIAIVALFIFFTFTKGCPKWDITQDLQYVFDNGIFGDYSDGNPFPDTCGNKNVWYFLNGSSLKDETSRYSELSGPEKESYQSAGLLRWFVDSNQPHSGISINITNKDIKLDRDKYQVVFPSRSVIVHPDSMIWIAIGWKSPINGYISIEGDITSIDSGGGDGIRWYIDNEISELASGAMKVGKNQNFLFEQESIIVRVKKEELVYFRFHPKNNWNHDTSLLNIKINQISAFQAQLKMIKSWF